MADERRPLPFWSVLALPALALGLVVLALQGSAWLRATVRGVDFETALNAAQLDPLNAGAVQALAFFGALVVGLRMFAAGESFRGAVALSPVPITTVLLAFVAGLSLQFPFSEVGNLVMELFPVPVEQQLLRARMISANSWADGITIVVAMVVIAPVTEELLFRGFLLPRLADRYGDGLAIGATSLTFGLIHMSPVAIVYATIAGVLLGIVTLRARSIWPAIVLHAGVNAMPVLLPERVLRIQGFNTVSEDVYHLPLALLVGAGVVAALALYAMMRTLPEDGA